MARLPPAGCPRARTGRANSLTRMWPDATHVPSRTGSLAAYSRTGQAEPLAAYAQAKGLFSEVVAGVGFEPT